MDMKYNKKRIPEGIIELEKEKNIYLYGIGQYADAMLDILNEYHIRIDGFFVSDGYMNENLYRDKPVRTYSHLSDGNYVIVAGFNILQHRELTDQLIYAQNIKKIYVLNGNDIYWGNGFDFLNEKVYLVDNYYKVLIKRGLDLDYYNQNIELFKQTYEWLSDEKSKNVMKAYLNGHINLLNFPLRPFWSRKDLDDQYFPGDLINLSDEEVFIDCGAYTGDTFNSFKGRVNTFKKYYALEPDSRRFEALIKVIREEEGNIVHIPLGAWNERSKLSFVNDSGCGMVGYTENCDNIEVDAIDNIVLDNEDVTFIKMDIEGSELNALLGAEKTLKRCRPKLAICVYHKKEDLITIPQYIKSVSEGYKLYIRPHMAYAGEVVLYGIHN